MTPEQLESLRINLRQLSNRGLIRFFHEVLEEINRRNPQMPVLFDPPVQPDLHNSYKGKP